jgi:hypothetical protein|tara:strand:- start:15021 stop:15290 length:270 start_codon:yes stop_codon:yes gene_type:complete
VKNLKSLSDLKNNGIIPAAVKNAIADIMDGVVGLKSDAADLVKDVLQTQSVVGDIVTSAGDLVDAVASAPENLFQHILDKVIPTDLRRW